jgi:branched-chain amino acid transport system substrate-binding protein
MSLTVANAYDAGMVLFEGIRIADATDAKTICTAVEGIKGYQGVNGLYSFSPTKHHGVTEKDLAIFQYVKADGKIKLQIVKD